jgi:PAS domain S-box-containing protein
VDSVVLAACAFVTNAATGVSLDQSVVLAATNLIQTWVAVVLLRRWCDELWGCGGTRALDSPRTTIRYVAALVGGMVAGVAVGAVGTFIVQNELTSTRYLLWFDRNFCGALSVTTLGLLVGYRIASKNRRPLVPGGRAEWVEIAAATVLTLVTYTLAFALDSVPMAFPLLAATVWVAVRFATLLSVLHSFAVGTATIVLTIYGYGPFAQLENQEIGVLLAQFFLAMLLVCGLLLSTGRDEREQLAAALAKAREEAVYQARLLDTVIHSMAEGIAVIDDSGEILMLNPAGAQALGYADGAAPTTVDGLDNLFMDGHPLSDTQRPSRRALNGEVLHDVKVELRAPGEHRVLSISASPLPLDPANHARAVMLIRDATTEHAQREELAAFAGVVAHDLRNPLAAIDGWTELLEDAAADGDLPPEVVREFLGRVRASSNRMHGLILHLLAHATSRNRNLSLTRLDLTESARRIAVGRDAADFVTVGDIPPAHGDRVLIDQVLENLIGNALKYVAAGVRPEVDVRGCMDNQGMVRVTITDNGIGLPEGQHEAIFAEFHRVHTTGYEGTGLGLAIARRIITRHGGTIVARDNPAGGTVFEFTLSSAK